MSASSRPLLGARYSPERGAKGHVESYFLKANDPRSRRALWLKTTIYASARGPNGAPHAVAEAWAIAFDGERGHVAVKSSVPFEEARFDPRALDVEVGGVTMNAEATRGTIETGGRSVAWDLALASDGLPIVHFPHPKMYEWKLPSTKIVSPFSDLRVTGSLVVRGERWDIDQWPGLLGHNWGPRHTSLYAWAHCNVWERADGAAAASEEEFVFEGLSAKTKIGPLLSPLSTLLCVRWKGVRYDLNSAIDLVTNEGEISPRRWRFAGQNRFVSLRGEIWATTDDFVGLFYENPEGPPTHCLNSKLAQGRIEVTARGRASVVLQSRAAALEIGTLDPSHGVRMYL